MSKLRFQRRHYEAIATVLRNVRHEMTLRGQHVVLDATVKQLCRMFEADNQHFQKVKFIAKATELESSDDLQHNRKEWLEIEALRQAGTAIRFENDKFRVKGCA